MNNKEFYYSRGNEYDNEDIYTIRKKIDDIFSKPRFTFKSDVSIRMKDGSVLNTSVVYKSRDYLLTIDNNKIYISNIQSISEL